MDLWEAKKARLEVLTGELVCLAEADGDDARRAPCAGHLKEGGQGHDTNELLAELSSPLRGEVALQRCHAFLFNPKFAAILGFDSLDATGSMGQAMFIKELVRRLRLEVLSPGDFAVEEGEVGHSVHFLSRGIVAVIAGKGQDSFQVASLSGGD